MHDERSGFRARAAVLLTAGVVLLAVLGVARAAPFTVVTDGPPATLLDAGQRAALGIHNGPDSIVDLWTDHGRSYLVFSGAATVQGRAAGGATFRLPVDDRIEQVTGPLAVLMRAQCRDERPDGGRACTRFDSDYAGAGTVFTCPGGRSLYLYHGENHTIPNGQRAPQGNAGWTGIGIAMWNPAQGIFEKLGQIAGLNASNAWGGSGDAVGTGQAAAASGNPSAVVDPSGKYVYLYYADRSQNPEAAAPGTRCDHRQCPALARVDERTLCADPAAARWQLWHDGRFGEPALLPDGTGGAFTPLFARAGLTDINADVTALPQRQGYVMTAIQWPGDQIITRSSVDGLHWSEPTILVPAPPTGHPVSYPRIDVVPGGLVLLYMQHNGAGWPNASFMRQWVKVVPG